MRYQIKYETYLDIINDKDPSWEEIATHFAMYGYDPLYVYKKSKLCYVITFQDFLMRKINTSLERGFIYKYTDFLTNADIEKAFLNDLDAERIVYVQNDKVVCEVNALIELALQNSIARNLMSLRYVKIFHQEMLEYLDKYQGIMILSDYNVYNYLQDVIKEKHMLHAENVEEAVAIARGKKVDICFDFLLTKKFRTILAPQINNVVDLCKVLTPFALHKLVSKAKDRGVSLLFYKLPRFQDLSCLHELEKRNSKSRTTIGQLIRDELYLDLFAEDERNKLYLRNKRFHSAQRLDNGYCFVMDEAVDNGINVHNGIRENGCREITGRIANFYGPCTTYGLFVENELTVPGMIQKYALENDKNIQLHNRAGIHGDNELNSIMEALMVPVTNGDIHVFLDVLEDLPYDSYPKITFVKNWFNEKKSINEVQFLDFPGHCNANANRIMAQYISKDLFEKDFCGKIDPGSRQPLLDNEYDLTESIPFTHVSFVKQCRINKKKLTERNIKGVIGAVVITGEEDLQYGKCLIDSCLLQCDLLYVFFVNANIFRISDNKQLNDYVSTLDSKKIVGIPLEYFFYAKRYFDMSECEEKIRFTQNMFFYLIRNELDVTKYFFHDRCLVYNKDFFEEILKEQSGLNLFKV